MFFVSRKRLGLHDEAEQFCVSGVTGKLSVPMARSVLLGCRVAGEEMGGSPRAHEAAQQEESLCSSVYLALKRYGLTEQTNVLAWPRN